MLINIDFLHPLVICRFPVLCGEFEFLLGYAESMA